MIFLFVVVILATFVSGVRSVYNQDGLLFSFGEEEYKTGIIALETDTGALFVSVTETSNIKNYVDIDLGNDLQVSRNEPLTLKLNVRNPGRDLEGFVIIDLSILYLLANYAQRKLSSQSNDITVTVRPLVYP